MIHKKIGNKQRKQLKDYLADSSSATWESDCVHSMKMTVKVTKDNEVSAYMGVFTDSECKLENQFILLSQSGTFKYVPATYYTTPGQYGYTYQTAPARFDLDLKPIESMKTNSFSKLAQMFLNMHANNFCFSNECESTKGRVRLNKIRFMSPVSFVGEFRNDTNVTFTLKEVE